MEKRIALFEEKEIRKVWHADDWYFSIVDVVGALTDNDYQKARNYWKWLKNKLKEEGSQLVSDTNQLKLQSIDGKYYKTDVGNTAQILRLIQTIPSPKAEPFKLWLAQVGAERLEEIQDPELAVKRARETYELKGYSKSWIETRMSGIKSRNKLTDEWKERGAKNNDYAILTNQIYKYGFGYTAGEIKKELNLSPKANPRDHMSEVNVVLTNLGETVARDLHIKKNSQGMKELKRDTKDAGTIISNTRKEIDAKMEPELLKDK